MRALDDILVLDLSRVLAGPWSTQMLADLGATVVKVEKPLEGDDTRTWGPPFIAAEQGQARGDAAYFLAVNRGKRSITVDMAHPEGQALIRALAARADVLVENYKVGGLQNYGLDYATLSKLNPRLVYCSVTGFGQTGPYAARAGYDYLMQGLSGLMSVTGERDDLPGAGPQKVGVPIADITTGLYASNAILAALNQRHRSGRGQYIDMALLDVQVAVMGTQAMYYLVSGKTPQRQGNGHNTIVPYQSFPTADGQLIIAVGNDNQFRKLCDELGRPEWGTDPRFTTNAARVEHRLEITGLIAEATRRYTSAALASALDRRSVPCGPIHTVDGTFADPQVLARGLRQDIARASGSLVPTVASPLRLSDSPVHYDRAPPTLGEHTDEVLAELLQLDPARLADLRSRGVI